MSYYTKITTAGLAAITAAMNNSSKVPITYMAFGDGNGYIPEPDENATSLVNEVYRVGVNKVEVHNKNPNWLVCEAIIPSAVGGFNIREVALYDSTGTTMLAIASYPPTYKPTVEEGAAKIQTIRIVIQVDNSGNFELIVDPDVILATLSDLKENLIDKNIKISSGRSLEEFCSDFLNLKDYYNLVTDGDWTIAIQRADEDALTQRKSINVSGGIYDYSGNITIQAHWFGSGLHCTRFRKTAPATITILNGSLRDITISPDSQIEGDTTDGLVADGVDRKYIENVLTEKHGGDGFVYKRGNLSRFFLRSRFNGGRGVTFANDIVSGDNKACEVWFECTANKKSGFFMENSATTSQNSGHHRGFIIAQNNGSDAIVDDNYNAVLSGNYNDLQLYTEYGGGVWHKPSLRGSRIFYSNISHTLFRDEANDSNIVSYIPSANGTRSTRNEKFEKITLSNENAPYSGKLILSHSANNRYKFEATGSSVQQYLTLPDNLTLISETNSYEFSKNRNTGKTIVFGKIPPGGSIERSIELSFSLNSLQKNVIANPAGNIGAGLFWVAFIDSTDVIQNKTLVKIRVINTSQVEVESIPLPWRISIQL